MTCGACANRVERKLNKIDGVSATVNYATEKASVGFSDPVTVDDVIAAVERAGYTATLPAPPPSPVEPDQDGAVPDPALAALRTRLLVCLTLTVPVVAMAMVPALQFTSWQWASLTLAAPVAVWGALPFHRAAWSNLRHGVATMDTLVSIGTLAAFGWSLYALFLGDAGAPGLQHPFALTLDGTHGSAHLYLEVAAGVTTFVLAGRYAETRARRRSGAALQTLLGLAATDASVLRHGREVRMPVDRLVVGDRFVVRPGDKVATDGVVVEGASAIDASMLTGEAVPAEVAEGDAVTGGCVNVGGRLVVEATRVGAETRLAQIAALVEQAQTGKAAVQRLADRVAGVFVPVVLVLAVGTFGFWLGVGAFAATAFTAATAVLIVACPCALGLATPTALLVGTGRGAQLGIVIKGPEVLESTRRIDTVLLDKTGTVTTGEMTVVDIVAAPGEDVDEVLAVAGGLQSASSHPIARAVVRRAEQRLAERGRPEQDHGGLPAVTGFAALDGLGVRGTVEGRDAVIGRRLLLSRHDIALPDDLGAALGAAERDGGTGVVVAWSGRARAVLVLADTVRPTSRAAVDALRRLGVEPILLTGDGRGAAEAVAHQVGITMLSADALPDDKVSLVRSLQADGRVVAVVGDGVNDAAALAQADLGIAMGTGTDAAIHASDLTLVRADLRAAADAIRLSRRTLGVVRANLFWAFAYNCLALPVAAAGLLNPMVAGAAMALSSVFVVSNSLRLRRFAALPETASG
ncbi:heavy metal translocating P-type ATPase [Pseudonocardia sp. DSM 45834]|uniref:Heavy metal translocating P-type ATPase n=1 Tax=Pseudonocardia charpentierae TaxID=3075545 RepID=A0ABU2N8H3_9PSEU|nr:heavy metal translocating P-type ATPase [Pseudonocardia sp. DSM 45834]MDT0350227.1 heavy metal translocating P-type ATPase [Pseudonocardia sp. DSM 45834]